MLLGGTAAAAGFALINAIGNLGGYAGPTMMGWVKETTGGYGRAMLVLAAGLFVLAGVVASLRLPSRTSGSGLQTSGLPESGVRSPEPGA